jgi:transcriptional regulator with XRE-family HTH domain
MDEEFWQRALGRLEAMERSQGWLAKKAGMSRQRLNNYVRGYRRTPDDIRLRVEAHLDLTLPVETIQPEKEAAAAA